MLERIRKVINYLVYQGVIKNDTDLAAKLKYTKSSLSQILNGVVPADKFVEKLCKFDKNINYVWIVNGEGEMLHIPPTTQTVSGNGNHDNTTYNSYFWQIFDLSDFLCKVYYFINSTKNFAKIKYFSISKFLFIKPRD